MAQYPFTLPQLDFKFTDLKPFISPFLIYTHYCHHHQTYVDKLNELIKNNNKLRDRKLIDIIKNSDGKIFNNACQHFNHSFFWKSISPKEMPIPEPLLSQILIDFGSLDNFKKEFIQKSNDMFGSGYTWIVFDPKDNKKKIKIVTTKDGFVPIINNLIPLLNLDLWEHAYYLDYTYQRNEFINKFWNHMNWNFANQMYLLALKSMNKNFPNYVNSRKF
jgi:Fe-Mn family superoxide dismutase